MICRKLLGVQNTVFCFLKEPTEMYEDRSICTYWYKYVINDLYFVIKYIEWLFTLMLINILNILLR